MKLNFIAIATLLLLSCCKVKEAPLPNGGIASTDFNILSETLLKNIKNGQDTKSIQMQLADTNFEELQANLKTDAQRYAFWVNIYNAYIIIILNQHPEYYQDKNDFFTKDQITIAGETVSFDKIEHGILRKSQWKLGLGYVRKWFPGKFERQLRVDKRDYRIHFALNCGAKDCPPVAIYTPEKINQQFEEGTKTYLQRTIEYDADAKIAQVTPLFSWFRGDFGGKRGTKKILESHGLLETVKGVELKYKDYDWTLDIDNFIEL
jgi:hypothetical protein